MSVKGSGGPTDCGWGNLARNTSAAGGLPPDVQAAARKLPPKERANLLLSFRVMNAGAKGMDFSKDAAALHQLQDKGDAHVDAVFADENKTYHLSQMMFASLMGEAGFPGRSVASVKDDMPAVQEEQKGQTRSVSESFMETPGASLWGVNPAALGQEGVSYMQAQEKEAAQKQQQQQGTPATEFVRQNGSGMTSV